MLLSSSDFNISRGGIQNTSYLMAQYFSKYIDVVTLCQSNGDSPAKLDTKNYVSKFSQRTYTLFSFLDLIKIYKKEHFDYALATHYQDGFGFVFLKWFFNVPYGIMTHGNEVSIKKPNGNVFKVVKFYLFTNIIRYLALKNATHIFSNTNYTASLVRELYPFENIIVIHPPISMKPSLEGDNSTKPSKSLLTICRLVERKGCQDVLRALPKVLRIYPEMKYNIVGEGEYEKYLKQLVNQLKLNDNVIFRGRVSDDEKNKLLSQCGLFVMPSFKLGDKGSVEGFGISYVEANSFGKFVIATKTGGVPEAVLENETGFLINEHDVENLSSSIIRFYDDNFEYDKHKCIEWAKKHHISYIIKDYLKVIGFKDCSK